jgi:hypothetical protein
MATIAQKLDSKTEAVRAVALMHAAASGPAAAVLAAKIATMLEDPSAAVQWQAMRTLLAVGAGAVDAAPILARQVRAGTPEMLVSRALSGLAKVGPAAHAQLEVVLEAWRSISGHGRHSALEALVRIAPDAVAVRGILLEALYSPEFSLRLEALRRLEEAPDELVDFVLCDARSRLATSDAALRERIAAVLRSIADRRPAEVELLLPALLEQLGEPCVGAALAAASKLPRPLAPSLLAHAIRIAGSDAGASEPAMKLIAELGIVAATARPVLLAQLHAHADALPLGGPQGRSSRRFAAAARAWAAACPSAEEAVPVLLAWLSRIPTASWPKNDKPSWYTIRDVALAAATLGFAQPQLIDTLVSIAGASRRWLEQDESGVRDFERALRKLGSTLGDPPALWQRLDLLGIARVEEQDARAAAEGDALELPEFPPEQAPPEPVHIVPVPGEFLRELAEVLRRGERYARVTIGATPEAIAGAVDAALRRAQRERATLSFDAIEALAALWGTAVARASGWRWTHAVQGDASWICLASADRAHACSPLSFISRQAEPSRETTALLLFNMIRAGNLPASAPGQLAFVG